MFAVVQRHIQNPKMEHFSVKHSIFHVWHSFQDASAKCKVLSISPLIKHKMENVTDIIKIDKIFCELRFCLWVSIKTVIM